MQQQLAKLSNRYLGIGTAQAETLMILPEDIGAFDIEQIRHDQPDLTLFLRKQGKQRVRGVRQFFFNK